MPRNTSGTYTLPAGNPVVSGTTISTTWANTTLGDLATEISDSVSRSGKGGFTAPVRGPDGTVAAPALAFTSEPASGLYRAAAGDVRLAVGGVDMLTPTGVVFPAGVAGVSTVKTAVANGQVDVIGNRNAADANADVAIGSSATRTAGYLVAIQNNVGAGGNKLLIDYNGLLSLGGAAGAIQPASIWTAITPDTGITASRGLGYTKDAVGKVHLRGLITNNTGGNTFNIATTNPLPVGFRPTSQRDFICSSGNSPVGIYVAATGLVQFHIAFPAGGTVALDGISFFAEQ